MLASYTNGLRPVQITPLTAILVGDDLCPLRLSQTDLAGSTTAGCINHRNSVITLTVTKRRGTPFLMSAYCHKIYNQRNNYLSFNLRFGIDQKIPFTLFISANSGLQAELTKNISHPPREVGLQLVQGGACRAHSVSCYFISTYM
ncbi:hypothetical protein RRG08_042875 [Elysia crispata]|uniref:Uncharacterized protein n=1 Tax=Elysia crispata TaxID=231223 RepID=A0AAE0YUV2_9GAST|nr:hypothetical protein RRG08_042875 [Elysia crispata]